jgi:hypothetical protein
MVASSCHPLVERVSDLLIGLGRRVLVDHRGSHAVVAHPRLQVRLRFPVRICKGPHKGELAWQPLTH